MKILKDMVENNVNARPPGPKGYPLVGVLPKMWGDPLTFLRGVAAEYGDLALVDFGSRQAFLLNNPTHIQYVLRDNYRNFQKSSTLSLTKRVLGQGLATNEGEFWRSQRKLMQPAFHRQKVAVLADEITAVTTTFLSDWRRRSGTAVDIHAAMMNLTLHIILQTMFGRQLENAAELGQAWATVLHHFNTQSWALLRLPESWPTPANRRFDAALKLLDEAVNGLIAARRAGPPGNDLLQLLLAAQDEETATGMSDAQLRDEIMTIFLAGHETSAIGLTWALYLLAQHPAKLDILRAEVEGVCHGRAATFADIPHLPYMHMVIEETMRLYPPFWLIYRAPVASDEISGYALAANDMVFICPAILHRHPDHWPRPDGFEPERFAPEQKRPSPFVYFPFGAGPRQCIGNEFALMEMRLVLASLVSTFDFQLIPGQTIQPEASVTLRPKHGIQMRLVARP